MRKTSQVKVEKVTRTCALCGAEFEVGRNRKFCSRACFAKARYAKRVAKRPVKAPVQAECLTCGQMFEQSPKAGMLRMFCSQECRDFEHLMRRVEAHVPKISPKAKGTAQAWLARRFAVIVAKFTGAL